LLGIPLPFLPPPDGPPPADASNASAVAQLQNLFAAPHDPTAHLEFDANVSAPCFQGPPFEIARVYADDQNGYFVSLMAEPPGAMGPITFVQEVDGATAFPSTAAQPFPANQWVHFRLLLQFSGTPRGSYTTFPLMPPPPPPPPPPDFPLHPNAQAASGFGPAELTVGISATGPRGSACTILYDNVFYDEPAVCP
jgi:hypothetical protein